MDGRCSGAQCETKQYENRNAHGPRVALRAEPWWHFVLACDRGTRGQFRHMESSQNVHWHKERHCEELSKQRQKFYAAAHAWKAQSHRNDLTDVPWFLYARHGWHI